MKIHPAAARPDAIRRKLMLALPGGLALASPLALLGCGGSDYSGPPSGTDTGAPPPVLPAIERSLAPVKIQLPAGVSITLDSTSLMTGNNASQVAKDGTAAAVMLESQPVMAYLFAADGRLLLMGVIEPGRPMLDSRSSAEALIYIASEVATLEPALQIALRTVLQTHAIVEPVRVAVEAALQRAGITDQDSELLAALSAALSVIRRIPAPGAALAAARAHALSLRIDPKEQISGITVRRDPGAFNTVLFENGFRRRAYAWVDRVGYFDADGKQVLLPTAVPLKDFDISATTSLSFDNLVIKVGDFLTGLAQDIGLIGAYQQGTAPFQAVSSDPVYLQIVPEDAQSSVYRTRIVGIGVASAGELSAAESAKLDRLRVQTFVEDVLQPVLKTLILPIISRTVSATFADDTRKLLAAMLLADIYDITVLSNWFPNTITALKNNDAPGMYRAFWNEFFTSNTWLEILKKGLTTIYTGIAGKLLPVVYDSSGNVVQYAFGTAPELTDKVAKLQGGLTKVAKVVEIVKALATVGDLVAIAKDWTASSSLIVFDLASSGSTLTFTPASVSATPGGTVPLTVALADAPPQGSDSIVSYEWTASGAAGGTLRNPQSGATGATMKTSSNTVDYVAAAGATIGAVDTVTAKAILVDRNSRSGNVIAVQKAPAVVSIGTMRLTPAKADFGIAGGDRQEFTVTFAQGSGDGLAYEWSCASLYGSISDGSNDTAGGVTTFRSMLPTVAYFSSGKALGGEIETVNVRVFRITSAAGAATETTETVATLQAPVNYRGLQVAISPSPAQDVPSDTRFALTAIVKDPLPKGAELTWVWEHSGVGTVEDLPSFGVGGEGAADFVSGATEGTATVTVRARVFVAGTPNRTTTSDPATVTLNVKKGLTTITFEVSGGTFACTVEAVCGVGHYTGFVVPKFAKAVEYKAVMSGFGKGNPYYDAVGNTRTQIWNAPVPDRGGIYFPVTDHPHGAPNTKFWCVWNPVDGRCVVTVTLMP
jgi:hypothetical protein